MGNNYAEKKKKTTYWEILLMGKIVPTVTGTKKRILATLEVFPLKDSSGEGKVKITAKALRKAISFGECF